MVLSSKVSRKEIRDWFYKALSPHPQELGKVYPVRIVDIEPDDPQERFINIYVSEGEMRESDNGLGVLTYLNLEIGFHLIGGKDDQLDHMEFIADRAINKYQQISPPPFDFYKTRFNYAGDSEDQYEQLYVSLEVITR